MFCLSRSHSPQYCFHSANSAKHSPSGSPFIILPHSFAKSQRAASSRVNGMLFFSLHREVDRSVKLDHLSSGLGEQLAAAGSFSLHSSSDFPKALFCCRKMQLFSDACQAFLPLAIAMRSDTLLMGTPLRVTLTWMKSVAGDRLEPSAFNK